MIGAAVLATGLLLVVAALFAARIPGRATFARPGISNPVRAFLLSPIHPTTWHANLAILLGLVTGGIGAAAIFALASFGLSILLAGVGVVLLGLAIEGARLLARMERRRLFIGEPARPAAHPYKPLRGGFMAILRAEFADENRWRDVIYVAVNLPLAVLELAVVGGTWVVALSLLTSPVWYDLVPGSVAGAFGPLSGHDAPVITLRALGGAALLAVAASLSQVVVALQRGLVTILLCTSAERALRQQVEVLRESRAAVLDVEATELHRIERDLHDGAQQRLVALTIDLGRASDRLESDPAAARALIRDGQEQARLALAELRDLVRGIAPSILLDRGVVAAIESIAGGGGSVATRVVSSLAPGTRFSPAIERAAYFVAAEALTNVAKHSRAARAEVRVRLDAGRLVVEIEDDGLGGAGLAPGGGLAGLERRVAGVDGVFGVSSPPGGPTVVRATFPVTAPAAQEPR